MTVEEKAKILMGRFDVNPNQASKYYSGVYAKQMFLPAGFEALSHKHKYDHMSILAKGECIVKTDSKETRYKAPAFIEIEKGITHSITAIKDVLWYCIHATDVADDANGVLIERV